MSFLIHLILECIAKEDCPPLKNISSLEIGMKVEIDSTTCCNSTKAVCDPSLCPLKPARCSDAFYDVVLVRSVNVTKCCDIFECSKFMVLFKTRFKLF